MSDAAHAKPERLFLLPGLAADHRLFEPQLEAFPQASVPAWMDPERNEPLESYAKRFSGTLSTDIPYAIGGFSFGGQVALEMVQHLDPKPACVVLICGVRGRHQLLPSFHRQQKLGAIVPAAIQRPLFVPFAKRFAAQNGLDEHWTRTLSAMANDNDVAFLKWSARACARWLGTPPVGVPIYHIHGEQDRIIPDVRSEADETIAGAKHLITWTHAQQVNDFIARACNWAS